MVLLAASWRRSALLLPTTHHHNSSSIPTRWLSSHALSSACLAPLPPPSPSPSHPNSFFCQHHATQLIPHYYYSSVRPKGLFRYYSNSPSSPSSSSSPISSTPQPPFHVGIVGSGPSGFYTCEAILEKYPNAHITIFERLPIPFGLIRYGVAPDHPEVKLVQKKFEKLLQDNANSCFFVGNIKVGDDVSIADLKRHYHAVVLAYGSEGEKKLGIPGENLRGVYSARDFVSWLNGHPDFQHHKFDLSTNATRKAVIIGQGNVALDVARMLLRTTEELRSTDITEPAIRQLENSSIQEVHVIGRRGPVQAAFTTKEFREILTLSNVETYVAESSMLTVEDSTTAEIDRPKRRLLDLLLKLKPSTNSASEGDNTKRRLYFHFFRKPVSFYSSPHDPESLGGVSLAVTKIMTGSDGKQHAVETGEKVNLDCDVVFRSIGYKTTKMEGVPFDDKGGIIPNILGRVVNKQGSEEEASTSSTATMSGAAGGAHSGGLYVSGWAKRGPSGIIATNKWDAEETAQTILQDWHANLPSGEDSHTKVSAGVSEGTAVGIAGLQSVLAKKGLRTVSFEEWKRIDEEERKRGKEKGKPLDKITIVGDMMDIISHNKLHT